MVLKSDLPITDIIQETSDVKTFRFGLTEPMEFKSGQFVLLRATVPVNGVAKPISRAFSIASSPLSKEFIDLTIRIYPDGAMSSYLDGNAKVGNKYRIEGPFGNFYYDESQGKNVVFLAAGTGIAPLMGMIRYIFDKKLDTKVTLINSSKTPVDIINRKELEQLMRYKNFKCIFSITRPEGHEWNGPTGRVDDVMIKKYAHTLDAMFYVCGPPDMVGGTVAHLKSLNVDTKKIKLEQW